MKQSRTVERVSCLERGNGGREKREGERMEGDKEDE